MALKLAGKPQPKKMMDLVGMGFTAEEAVYLKTLHWQAMMHMNCEDGNTMVHGISAIGIERATYTPKTHAHKDDYMGTFGTPETKYFVAGEEEPFPTFVEALACLREKHRERIVAAMKDAGMGLTLVPPSK